MAKHEPPSRPQPRQPKPPPQCKAILLCERTIIEAGTGRVSLINTFERFEIPAFPGVSRRCELFLLLVDGIGRYDLVIEILDLRTDIVLARAPASDIEWPERLARIVVIVPIPPIPLEHVGEYDIVVLGDGQEIDRLKFSAIEVEGGQDAAEEDG